jgi:hypothetical protein
MRIDRFVRGLVGVAFLLFPIPVLAQIQLSPVVSGLSSPVFVGNAGDNLNRLFIVERAGIIKVLQPGSSTPTVFLDIRSKIVSGGEQGLLGLAFHPQYSSNGRFFVFYTRTGDGALVIAEYIAAPASSDTAGTTEKVILTIPHPTNTNHNGGMLAFGPDGYLYIGVGDGGSGNDPPNNAQNTETLLGKILRIDVDSGTPYSPPPDNPFVGLPGRDEIYAYGFRNPWRFSFDPETSRQWVGDVGQGSREEVDTPIVNGGNYGWRVFEGSLCTQLDPELCDNQENYIFPVFDYSHSGGRCSLTGGYVYRGSHGTMPAGTYIYGDFCSGEIFAWSGTSQNVLLDTGLSISSFGEDEQGELYVVHLGGSVSRIVRSAPCTYSISPTRATYGPAGGSGAVTVTAGAGCAWSATSNTSWISVTGSGTGNGSVNYTVAPYTGKPKKRNGSLTIAGQTFTVQQLR